MSRFEMTDLIITLPDILIFGDDDRAVLFIKLNFGWYVYVCLQHYR